MQSYDQRAEQDHRYGHGGGYTGFVPSHKLRRPITSRIFAGDNRQVLQMAANVTGKLFDRGIAALRLLTQRHENDVVQIASQAPAEFLKPAVVRITILGVGACLS